MARVPLYVLSAEPLITDGEDNWWVRAHVETKVAPISASWRSGGPCQRQITPQAAPSVSQPRPTSCLGRAGTQAIQASPCFRHRCARCAVPGWAKRGAAAIRSSSCAGSRSARTCPVASGCRGRSASPAAVSAPCSNPHPSPEPDRTPGPNPNLNPDPNPNPNPNHPCKGMRQF